MRLLVTGVLLCLSVAAQTPKPVPIPVPVVEVAAVEVGKAGPSFRVNDDAGAMTEVGGKAKTWTVLAFYPKASTGG